ncbi:MAG TPA: glycosyltransferase, partial [Aldersonia sp.]
LRSLFPSPDTAVHDIARPWTERLVRPGAVAALAGVLWAAVRHPRALAAMFGVVLHRYRRSPKAVPRALVTVALACAHARDLERSGRPCHIHAHYATYPALAAWVCHRLLGVSYSFTAHAHDIYVDQTMLADKIAAARFVVTISAYNRDLLAGIADGATPVEVVHCGIDTARYPFRARPIPADGPVRALCVASLQEYKGHAVLLQALALGGAAERIHLDLIGDGVLRESLEALAIELGIADRVQFLGSRTESDVAQALAGADLFVLPSVVAADGQMEGLPVALMESLACGIPTVSTALSGIPEIVLDGVTGMLSTPGDAADLHSTLLRMLDSGAAAVDYGVAGRKLVEGEFDIRDTSVALLELFERYVGN